MTFGEKLEILLNNHFQLWLETQKKVEDELSQNQPIRCVCGRLATGLHEMNCQRFKNKVKRETVKRMKHLL